MPFDSKSAISHAVRFLADTALKRNAGGWIPPREEERQRKEQIRQELQQTRDAERQAKEQKREHEKSQKLLSKQFPTHYMPNVGRQVMNTGGVPDQPQRQLSPMGFYSAAAERAQTLQPSGDAVQMVNALKNTQGIKTEELQNAGLIDQSGNVHPDWAGRGKVSREDLVSHLQGQMPQIEETVLGGPRKSYEKVAALEGKVQDAIGEGHLRNLINGKLNISDFTSDLHPLLNEYMNAYNETIPKKTKYEEYTLPGGENYREVLLRLPNQQESFVKDLRSQMSDLDKTYDDAMQNYYRTAENNPAGHPDTLAAYDKVREIRDKQYELGTRLDAAYNKETKSNFKSSHWDDPNVLAHIRMADRTGPNGEKILHVEELQSDWGQKGKKEGFANLEAEKEYQSFVNDMRNRVREQSLSESINAGLEPERAKKLIDKIMPTMDADKLAGYLGERDKLNEAFSKYREASKGLPSAPYVTSTEGWTDLALKRVLKEAAEGGYDKVVWTPGAEQAKRYDLSKHIDELHYAPSKDNKTVSIQAYKDNSNVLNKNNITWDEAANMVGKDMADKMFKKEKTGVDNMSGYNILSGLDLQTGGEGMKGYYDTIVPKRLQNLAKKHDKAARLGYVNLGGIVAPNTELDELSGAINFDRPKKEKPKLQFNLPSLDITPAMRESILRGQSAYKRGGAVSKRHPALSIAGTHIREEEHGEPIFTGRL